MYSKWTLFSAEQLCFSSFLNNDIAHLHEYTFVYLVLINKKSHVKR